MEPAFVFPSDSSADSLTQILDTGVMDQLLELDDGRLDLLIEMFGLFQADTPGRIEAIQAHLAAGELSELADIAHAVKGAAATMGVPRLRAIAAELERGGRKGAFNQEPERLVQGMRTTYAEARTALEAFIASRN
jgi:HPt (histidine-containing phosphotransfer) domain-containing protein